MHQFRIILTLLSIFLCALVDCVDMQYTDLEDQLAPLLFLLVLKLSAAQRADCVDKQAVAVSLHGQKRCSVHTLVYYIEGSCCNVSFGAGAFMIYFG